MSVKPRPTEDDFYRFFGLIEEAGGMHVADKKCKPKSGKIKSIEGEDPVPYETYGCNRPWLFMVPYEPGQTVTIPAKTSTPEKPTAKKVVASAAEIEKQKKAGGGFVRVCFEGDRVDLWPRFAKAAREGDE